MAAATSPFATTGLDVKLTALFTFGVAEGHRLQLFVHVKGDLLRFRDEGDGRQATDLQILGLVLGENGSIVDTFSGDLTAGGTLLDVQKLRRGGLLADFYKLLYEPGGYQVRVAVRDPLTGRVGAARQFLELPAAESGQLVVSSLWLQGRTDEDVDEPGETGAVSVVEAEASPGVRRFRPGSVVSFSFIVYNDENDQAYVRQVRLLRDRRPVYVGSVETVRSEVKFGRGAKTPAKGLVVESQLRLPADLEPGAYEFEVTAGVAGSPGGRRWSVGARDFEIVP